MPKDEPTASIPWWVLLLDAYEEEGTQGRLGLAFLAAAREKVTDEQADAHACMGEIAGSVDRLVEIHRCPSSRELVIGVAEPVYAGKQTGLRLGYGLSKADIEMGIDGLCRKMVEDATRLLEAGTPSMVPAGMEGYRPDFFSAQDIGMIESVREHVRG